MKLPVIVNLCSTIHAYSSKGDVIMNLSAPTLPVFLVSVIVAIVAVLVLIGVVPAFGIAAAWLALIAYAILLVGNVMSGL